jgi:hypothetical protein
MSTLPESPLVTYLHPQVGPVAELEEANGVSWSLTSEEWDGLATTFAAFARVPLRYEVYQPTHPASMGEGSWMPVTAVIDDGGTRWYTGFNEDCFQPLLYLVRADSWDRAYDALINDEGFVAKSIAVTDHHEDYGPTDTWKLNDSGVHIDDEATQVWGPVEGPEDGTRIRLRGAS